MQTLTTLVRSTGNRLVRLLCLGGAIGTAFVAMPARSQEPNVAGLFAGASIVDITPTEQSLPAGFRGVNDPIYVRAIVLDNGSSRAALVSVDIGVIPTDLWSRVSARVERDLDIPAENLILSATHTHSVPHTGQNAVENPIVEAVRTASERAVPARMSFGTGISYINVNRNIVDKKTRRWWEGPNYDGPSDKTVAVLEFSTADEKPIAILYNYGVHAVVNGQLDEISGDIPGAASRYIEDSLENGAVALWSLGAAGDQNPVYFNQTYELREIRIAEFAKRGEDISNAMPPGGAGLDRENPRVAKLMEQQRQLTNSMGQMLGEEVLHTLRSNMQRPKAAVEFFGAGKTVYCPGRRRTDSGRAGYPGTYVDAEPVPIRLSLLRLGDTIIGGVDGEVFAQIGQRFKRESPYKNSMMATLTNGFAPSGYIASDAAAGFHTFEVVSSRLKAGCAESAIVDGLLDLMDAEKL